MQCTTKIVASFTLAAFIAACAIQPATAADVDLVLRAGSGDLVQLLITNQSKTMLSLPADIVNGPRDTSGSVFLIVQDEKGRMLKRCAIVELEPGRMRDVLIAQKTSEVLTIPVSTLKATYCVQKLRVQAVFGSLSMDDRVIPSEKSNVITVGN